MCGRFTLATPAAEWAALFELDEVPDFEPRYNIAPTQEIPVVRADPEARRRRRRPETEGGGRDRGPGREFALLRWGLVPHWTKELGSGPPLINARSETVAERPSFRDSYNERRCLVVADGFYEWQPAGRRKQPYWIGLRDRRPFAFAGLWDQWRTPEGQILDSCTILTTDTNDALRDLHDRMPVILDPKDHDLWLDLETVPWELESLLRPYPPERIAFFPVSTRVNWVDNDDPECVEPLETQTELF
jgi:putative SOS response-associated peptidase YedK